jgi:CBS domain containing-hemolysin-like protein
VYDRDLDHIVGSIHIKDVLRHLLANRPVSMHDARPLPYVPGPTPLDEVVAAMRRYRAQMAVVMDQHGGTAGIVTMEDLFEEVVGDIEEGRNRTPIVRQADGRLRVRGTVRLSEVGEALDRVIEHPKVTTVSGLVLLLLGGPATVGATVSYAGVTFEVTEVAGRGVRTARVSVPA